MDTVHQTIELTEKHDKHVIQLNG